MPLKTMLDSSAESPTPRPQKAASAPKTEKPALAPWLTGDVPETTNPFLESLSEASPRVQPEVPELQPMDAGLTSQMLVAGSRNNIGGVQAFLAEQPLESQEDRDRAAARAATEQQLGLNGPKRNKVYQMSDDEYLALSPRQRAAIDFNTALVTAVRQDKRNQEKYQQASTDSSSEAVSGENSISDEQRKLYESDIESMFGKGRDSDMYAPATVALLKDIGYENANADLDDFLNLKVAITDKDLKNFTDLTPKTGGKQVASPLFAEQALLSDKTQMRLQEIIKQGELILGNTYQTLTQSRSNETSSYGGLVPPMKNTAGFTPGDPLTEKFQTAFEQLGASKEMVSPESLGALNQWWTQAGVDPDTFWTYVNQRIDQAAVEGGTLGSVGYQPDEMRKLLGLEPKGR